MPTSEGSAVAQVRWARPTGKLSEVVAFYRDALGLEEIFRFEGHRSYDGVMLALPGRRDHIEFLAHPAHGPCLAPSDDNLLVLYVPDPAEARAMVERMAQHGHHPVPPDNAYWADKADTFVDPEGWRVVICRTGGL